MKKTGIKLFIIIVGIVFLAACRENTPVSVKPTVTPTAELTKTPEVTLTPTQEPTSAPVNTPTQVPVLTSSPSLTKAPEVTLTPTVAPSLTVTPTPSPSPTKVPEVTLTPSPTPSPTATPSPTPSPTPTPSPSPTPTINPVPLVANGWQGAADITQQYLIVFPECFRDSTVNRTNTELTVEYISDKYTEIRFIVNYHMLHSYEEAMEEIMVSCGTVLEEILSERRFSYSLEDDIMVYQGIVIEMQYPKALLGDSFGEEEFITGTMQVVFSYPQESRAEYETEPFRYFVVSVP